MNARLDPIRMTTRQPGRPATPRHIVPAGFAAAVLGAALLGLPAIAAAQAAGADRPAAVRSAAPKDSASTSAAKPAAKRPQTARKSTPAMPAPEPVVTAADDVQLAAAAGVMMGPSNCEFGQKIEVDSNDRHPGYVDLSFNKRTYLMKPVLSPTGALRLEDVRSETLLIQIGSKTMLMNQKTGQRLVDNCIHPQHQTITAANRGPGLGVEPAK